MLAKLRSRIHRPGPATAIAFVALVFAMAGGAVAKDKIDKDEVTNVTTTGGPIQTTDPAEEGEPTPDSIPLGNPTFTQKAGEVALVSVEADVSGVPQETASCDLIVSVVATGAPLGFELAQLAQRGDPTIKLGDSQALPAPASDRQITLSAQAAETIPPDEQGEPAEDVGQCDSDTFTVSLRVSVTTLRN